MRAVMLPLRPDVCERVLRGAQTVLIRKSKPRMQAPFTCYIYCTKNREFFTHGGLRDSVDDLYRLPDGQIKYGYSGELMLYDPQEYGSGNFLNGKVIAEFTCSRTESLGNIATDDWKYLQGDAHEEQKKMVLYQACMAEHALHKYAAGQRCYAWQIQDLQIYDKPRKITSYWQRLPYIKKTRQMRALPKSWCYVEKLEDMTMLKKGDRVTMNDLYWVSEKNKGRIWTVESGPWDLCGTQVVKLSGLSSFAYAVDGLALVPDQGTEADDG